MRKYGVEGSNIGEEKFGETKTDGMVWADFDLSGAYGLFTDG